MADEKKKSGLRAFLDSYKGKTLFNYFYGFGAAVAILGTLFKILHLDGANIMLAVGLGTEVLMFAISAFEPPFRQYRWDEVFPVLKSGDPNDRPSFEGGQMMAGIPVMNGSAPVAETAVSDENDNAPLSREAIAAQAAMAQAAAQAALAAQAAAATAGPAPESIQAGAPATIQAVPTSNQPEMAQVTIAQATVAQASLPVDLTAKAPLVSLSDKEAHTLEASLKEYIENMDTMNLHLRGLNTIYEIQLKSISSQIDTIDKINQGLVNIRSMYEGSANDSERFLSETESMANNLSSLNQIYGRMLQAMMTSTPFPGMPSEPAKAETPKA